MNNIHVFTIGFTKKSAESFFTELRKSGVKRLIDVRLNNVSQLAGFAKKGDLRYFLHEICNIEYLHLPELAPTQTLFDDYKKKGGKWEVYEKNFLRLMSERCIEEKIPREILDGSCLLCSEDKPHFCHRRLVAEYLKSKWGNVNITHLM
jgi:uncharacterized protein (DUF488 family)